MITATPNRHSQRRLPQKEKTATPGRPPPSQNETPIRASILKKVSDKNDASLRSAIHKAARDYYEAEAKELQVDAVFNLVRGKNTFILAGTGFGKSRIAEMYSNLLVKSTRGVILVLNPLDSLGDNQVLEKEAAGFSAINLTKLTFNADEARKIANGDYNFVYLSPEIFLNSKTWEECYFSEKFQNRLALVVVDEAHIIYQWGIVESTKGRTKVSAMFRYEDRGMFRPSYGSLGGHLLTRNNKPILLMSATCRPVAIKAIQESLKLEDHNLSFVRGELTRPEIQIIRVDMEYSMASCGDLLKLFPLRSDTPDCLIVPTLVYSSSKNRTLQVMKMLNTARGTPEDWQNPHSLFVRRFHSCTGNQEKINTIADFANGDFPLVSCTMALGMGQNWARVRSVIHMGRGDPSAICQMIGRCGRDGRSGLAIILVEKERRGGKNRIEDFPNQIGFTDDDRMDALAITPVCLRIAFAIDNRVGHIPLSFEDPAYRLEQEREKKENFPPCKCSNCMPQRARGLIAHMKEMTQENMDSMLGQEWEDVVRIPITKRRRQKFANGSGTGIKISDELAATLATMLQASFNQVYVDNTPQWVLFSPVDVFGEFQIKLIRKYLAGITCTHTLRRVIGGETVSGQLAALYQTIVDFKNGPLENEKQRRSAEKAEVANKKRMRLMKEKEEKLVASGYARPLAGSGRGRGLGSGGVPRSSKQPMTGRHLEPPQGKSDKMWLLEQSSLLKALAKKAD